MKKYVLFALIAFFFVSSSAWADTAYVKLKAEDGTASWIKIKGTINGDNIMISSYAIDNDTEGSIDLNEVWSESGGIGTHYQVTSIKAWAFWNCSGLTSIEIPSSVTSIGTLAFSGCSGLKKVIVKDIAAWCNISFGDNPLKYAYHLYSDENTEITELIIPSSVESIGSSAFYGCISLASIDIPSSVTSIGSSAFSGCTGLTSIEIPNSVKSIGYSAFSGCSGLTSVDIPSSVTYIGNEAFNGCSGLKKVIVKDIAAWCNISFGDNPLKYAYHLYSDENTEITELIIPSSVTSIGECAFWNCSGLTSIEIPNSVTSIGNHAFEGCRGLTSVTIGNGVTSIGEYAFQYCSGLNKVIVKDIAKWCYIRFGDYNANPLEYAHHLYSDENTEITELIIPSFVNRIGSSAFSSCSGLTSVDIPSSVTYIGYEAFSGCTGLTSVTIGNGVESIGYSAFSGCSGLISTTSTSISTGFYLEDGSSRSFQLYNNDKIAEVINGHVKFTGLDPMQNYTIYFSYTKTGLSCKTKELTITTSQPKVISAGNVIVAAESNLYDEETKVGFEWRRTDWTDDFLSNTGTAYLYNGTMEGYIRNLYTEKLWKYRPYYTSNAGNTYYGDWVGIDPTNTSYFEPTVHTYANVSVNGNSAEVKGYVQRGTDNVVSKGFAYWEQPQGVKSREAMSAPSMISSLPSNAKTIEVSGSQQVMTASLPNLEYETTYCYVAFVRTSEGDTFYGEEMTFTSGESPYTLGDVNGDKQIDISDVVAMVNHILGNTSSTSFKPQAADINKDSNIDISDVVSLVNMILGQ